MIPQININYAIIILSLSLSLLFILYGMNA